LVPPLPVVPVIPPLPAGVPPSELSATPPSLDVPVSGAQVPRRSHVGLPPPAAPGPQ
jgi:hypothetical protein